MILLTGATGFLGAHTCASLLQKGYAVRACKRQNSSLKEFETIFAFRFGEEWKKYADKVEWVEAEIHDYDKLADAMEGIEAVFHLAAVVSFWPKRREELFYTNVEGTANMVNVALAAKVPWFIHASSIAAIGRDEKHPVISEENEWIDSDLNSQYAISKNLAEREVWRGREEGLKASIVNPGVILGEGDWNKGSCRLLKKVMNGMPYYTDGQNGYVDVLDVAEAMILLYDKKIDGERILLVGENLSPKAFISQAAEYFGQKPPTLQVKPWMGEVAWRVVALLSFFTGKEPLLTKETAKTGTHHFTYSSQKAVDMLGLKFTPLEETLRRVKKFLA